MFALTQVAFIETLVIKRKTRLGTADGAAGNASAQVCRVLGPSGPGGRAGSAPRCGSAPPLLCPGYRPGMRGPWASGPRESSLLGPAQTGGPPILAPTEANKTAKRILTGDLNPVLSRSRRPPIRRLCPASQLLQNTEPRAPESESQLHTKLSFKLSRRV